MNFILNRKMICVNATFDFLAVQEKKGISAALG